MKNTINLKKLYLLLILVLAICSWHLHLQNTADMEKLQELDAATLNSDMIENTASITAVSHYPKDAPSDSKPLLTWSEDLNMVYYELEIFSNLPDDLSDAELSPNHIYYSATIYTNAVQIDLTKIAPQYLGKAPLYWRVRSMDIDHNPISKFSKPEILYSQNTPTKMNSPLPHVKYNNGNGTVLLYPVYSYVGNANATKFEIEVTDAPPENPNGISASAYRVFSKIVTGGELYDSFPRIGTYYWRVRGLDDDDNPVGVYCDAQEIRNEPSDNWKIGVLGDSISHGGGHLSYGPADWAYSYEYYLNFPTINLSFSGDTSSTTLERFDRDVLPFHPQYLLIMTGTNSLRAGVPAESVIDDLKQIQEKCRQNNITPILLTLAPINPYNIRKVFDEGTIDDWQDNFAEVNEFIRTQPHIDTAAALNSPAILPTHYAMDGLHGDVEAKKIYAQAINDNISQFIAK